MAPKTVYNIKGIDQAYMYVMLQSSCLVVNPTTANDSASLFDCTPVGHASDSRMYQGWVWTKCCLLLDNSRFN